MNFAYVLSGSLELLPSGETPSIGKMIPGPDPAQIINDLEKFYSFKNFNVFKTFCPTFSPSFIPFAQLGA
jgi:hypothetical protein